MRFELDGDERALRDELRGYFSGLRDELLGTNGGADHSGQQVRATMKRLGDDGWLGIGYPVEYGGQGRSALHTFIIWDEALRAGIPLQTVTIMTIGPALMRWGTEEQKRELLPRILSGELVFAIGYTEPRGGTDLGALTTRADLDHGEFVISGQKTFTSRADYADYVWLAARTDPGSRGFRGISILIVPTSAVGFSYSKIDTTMPNVSTTSSFYDEVRVRETALVGELHGGGNVIAEQLNLERLTLVMPGPLEQLYEDVLEWAVDAPTVGSGRVADEAWVRQDLGRVRAHIDALKWLSWRAIWQAAADKLEGGDASIVKVFASEMFVDCARLLLGVIGGSAVVRRGSPGAVLHGRVEEAYRAAAVWTFGGGVNEIQREIIAQRCLDMPPTPRRLARSGA